MPLSGIMSKYGFDGGWASVFYCFGKSLSEHQLYYVFENLISFFSVYFLRSICSRDFVFINVYILIVKFASRYLFMIFFWVFYFSFSTPAKKS